MKRRAVVGQVLGTTPAGGVVSLVLWDLPVVRTSRTLAGRIETARLLLQGLGRMPLDAGAPL